MNCDQKIYPYKCSKADCTACQQEESPTPGLTAKQKAVIDKFSQDGILAIYQDTDRETANFILSLYQSLSESGKL